MTDSELDYNMTTGAMERRDEFCHDLRNLLDLAAVRVAISQGSFKHGKPLVKPEHYTPIGYSVIGYAINTADLLSSTKEDWS